MGASLPCDDEPPAAPLAAEGHPGDGDAPGEGPVPEPESSGQSRSEALAAIIGRNPHCKQLLAPAAEPFVGEVVKGYREFRDDDRYLSKALPRMKYCRRPDSQRSSLHWGQLKLLESELKCLLDFISDDSASSSSSGTHLIVYAGAAPGAHIPSLARRFPSCKFELYDPASFDQQLVDFAASEEGKGKVTLVNDFFTDEQAQQIAERGQPSVFFSDIRTADPTQMKFEEVEDYVERDMQRQKEWARILRPGLSVLKFRLPWGPGTTSYLRGKVLVQAFPPCTSTETRLLVPRAALDEPEVAYDQEEYEEQLMHHNTVTRAFAFDHGVEVPGLDHCYDCTALVRTVQRFLERRPLLGTACSAEPRPPALAAVSPADVAAEIDALIKEFGQSKRSLETRYHVSSSRHGGRQFNKRRYFDSEGKDHFSEEPAGKKARGRGRRAG